MMKNRTIWRQGRYTSHLCVGYVVFLLMFGMSSCVAESSPDLRFPTALVTVKPQEEGVVLQLDDTTVLEPTNMRESPFGDKEVRALVNYSDEALDGLDIRRRVYVHWIDSIRTKGTVPTAGEYDDSLYGNDPIEVVNNWVTIAEDGYLTLQIRAQWSYGRVHYINILTGTNPDDPYELELRHDARGDIWGNLGDALVAFNLNDLPPRDDGKPIKLTLVWHSYTGKKSIQFNLHLQKKDLSYSQLKMSQFIK